MRDQTTQILAPECIHCRDRLSALERLCVAHGAKLGDHDAALASIRAELSVLTDGNRRIEAGNLHLADLLERLLGEVRELRGVAA